MTAGSVKEPKLEKHVEKQMGCMSGFLQIFDRHQLSSRKRLPPSFNSQIVNSSLKSKQSIVSVETSRESENQQMVKSPTMMEHHYPLPETLNSMAENQPKSALALPVLELKEGTRSSWKFSREAPRLSLDSRATTDAKGSFHTREIRTNSAGLSSDRCDNSKEGDHSEQQHRSPSVIARLMGLQSLQQSSDTEPFKKAELRRSASESRVSKDLCQYRFVDGNTFQSQQTNSNINITNHVLRDNAAYFNRTCNQRLADSNKHRARDVKVDPLKAHQRGMRKKKSFFDSADIFPEPKRSITVYSEIEKRLKIKGINEQSKYLETLKQILEAHQLKGLLHLTKPANQINYRNFVYDRSISHDEYPIVVMKPTRSLAQINRTSRIGGESPSPSFRSRPGVRLETLSSTSPRSIRPDVDRNLRNQSRGRSLSTPSRCESNVNCPNRRRPLSIETQKKKGYNDMMEQRSVSPIKSPKVSQRRMGSVQNTMNRLPRNKKPTPEIYTEEERVFLQVEHESSTMSESSIRTSSQTDTERSKMEYKDGRNLLERCDKLLHSIAELQPSPVSVLDSSFYNEESPPSPIMKRSIDFKDQPFEQDDGTWGLEISAIESNDCDLIYVSEILRASNYLSDESDVFLLLEKQQYPKGNDTSKVSRLQRRLIFDTIIEIVIRKRKLSPWKEVCLNSKAGLQQIWSEFQRIRKRDESEDLFEVIGGVLRKDLAGDDIHGWGDYPIEMAESILDIERLIFKDLISETILDLATYASKFSRISASCRKLSF